MIVAKAFDLKVKLWTNSENEKSYYYFIEQYINAYIIRWILTVYVSIYNVGMHIYT